MKKQNKIPEKELNKMEISNLSDAEFKKLVIRILKEIIGYCKRIKKTQAEVKVKISEINKNLQEPIVEGTKLENVENQINDLEHKEQKSIQSEQQEEKRIKKKTR